MPDRSAHHRRQDRIVSPGFIDVHAHIEFNIFTRPTADLPSSMA